MNLDPQKLFSQEKQTREIFYFEKLLPLDGRSNLKKKNLKLSHSLKFINFLIIDKAWFRIQIRTEIADSKQNLFNTKLKSTTISSVGDRDILVRIRIRTSD